jgi:hypothetical protein
MVATRTLQRNATAKRTTHTLVRYTHVHCNCVRSPLLQVVLVINKVDILNTAAEREQVIQFVGKNGALLLQHGASPTAMPTVFALSARKALSAKIAAAQEGASVTALQRSQEWQDSNFQALEVRGAEHVSDLVEHITRLPCYCCDDSTAGCVLCVCLRYELCVCLNAVATCDVL